MRSGGPKIPSGDMGMPDIYYGIVTQNKDPDKLERIKVRLPFLDQGETDQTEWAQLATPMEGNLFGWYSLPDIEDVVAVSFIAGDIKRPVIMGGVWSKKDAPPEGNEDGKNNFRGYCSRSGHRMILDDSDCVKVVFSDKTTDMMIGIGAFASAGTGVNKCEVRKPGGAGSEGISITSATGTLEVTAKGTLIIKAGQNITISTTAKIGIKAGSNMQFQATSIQLSSSAPSNYKGSTTKVG
jgi:uncharacterized protein involved in type VI secretion and phage assembly